ncbi:hypothetical protein D9613_006263 [Agrocybe pediades]|uniref:DUF6533 domain-containing protein n=1 Tax=Agrocybe pediades TaxID=84607 RepID=A0A8H4QUM9_9AGAR|nr:hypothetical protein D9613_006263 [Agrocybe pediades]
MPNTLLEKRKPLSGSLPFCTRPRAELQACWELCRLHNNIGFWVVWLPTAWSITMAYHAQQSITIIDYFACLLKFVPLCYGIKSLIMTIDDILDADVDGMVARTKMRPIPRGDISLARAWIFFGAQVIIGVPLACVSLSSTSLIVCAIVCPLYVIYPTCKRWTNLAPIPLGIMFKIGIFIGWAELANSQVGSKAVIPWHMLAPIYIGTCMWTITYETVYQHQMESGTFSQGVINLGFDLFSIKLYWVAVSTLWFYDYFLTLRDEVRYGWSGTKTPVFWLYILVRSGLGAKLLDTRTHLLVEPVSDSLLYNHYSRGVLLGLLDLRSISFSCTRYGFMETLETMLTTFVAEILIALRVYALSKKSKLVVVAAGIIMAVQWAIAIFVMSQHSKGTDQVVFLMDVPEFPPPKLPDIPAYHVCIFITVLSLVPWVQAWLALALAFDALAFLAIIVITAHSMRLHGRVRLMQVIQRDGIIYFFVLFGSNLTWLLLTLYARPALKFIHNQPAMIVSCIMINRITLSLKRARDESSSWSVKTFETLVAPAPDNFIKLETRNTAFTNSQFSKSHQQKDSIAQRV